MFLRAALVELLPSYSLPNEITFQSRLLEDVFALLNHSAPQVGGRFIPVYYMCFMLFQKN
jgi:hypothetical protein